MILNFIVGGQLTVEQCETPTVKLMDVSKSLNEAPRKMYPKFAIKSSLDDLLSRREALKRPEDDIKEEIKEEEEPELDPINLRNDNIKIPTSDPLVAQFFAKADTFQGDAMALAESILSMKNKSKVLDKLSECYSCYCYSCRRGDDTHCYSPSCLYIKASKQILETLGSVRTNKAVKSETVGNGPIKLSEIKQEVGEKDEYKQEHTVCYAPGTKGKVYLKKIKVETNKKKRKIVKYPLTSTYRTRGGRKPSVLILPQHELLRLARKGGLVYCQGFNHTIRVSKLCFYTYTRRNTAFKQG